RDYKVTGVQTCALPILLLSRYAKRLDSLCELTDKEVHRLRNDPQFGPLAQHYRERLYHLRRLFHDRYKRDLVFAFKRLQDQGVRSEERRVGKDGRCGGL